MNESVQNEATDDETYQTLQEKNSGRDYWPTDGWKTSTPEKQGMDPQCFTQLKDWIEQKMSHIHSFIVVHNGYIVFEKYTGIYNKHTMHHVACSIKTLIASLVGVAIEEGLIESEKQKISEFFPEYFDEGTSPIALELTIEDVLTNTPGFSWQEDRDYPLWISSGDCVQYLLEKEIMGEPGEFRYNTACPHLLGVILSKVSKMKTQDYAMEKILGPIGISNIVWWTDKNGYINPGTALMTPRDMAKLGYLYLNKGRWDGMQLIPEEWVSDATSEHNLGGAPHYEHYGYQFWITEDHGYPAYFGGGRGGQFIYVVPEPDIVVAITSDSATHHEENRYLVGKYVIPSIVKNE